MALDTNSDQFMYLSALTAIAFAVLSVLCIAIMVLGRFFSNLSAKRRQKLNEYWMDFLFESITREDSDKLLASDGFAFEKREINKLIRKNDLAGILHSWNYLQESTKGKTKDSLNFFVEDSDLEKRIINMLGSRDLEKKLLAISTLGHIKEGTAWPDLKHIAASPDPVLSTSAATAMFRINLDEAKKEILPMLTKRRDWSPVLVAKMLEEAGYDNISEELVALVRSSFEAGTEDRQMGRLISYLRLVRAVDYKNLVNHILSAATGRETLISCLRLANWPEALPRIRELAKDERWQVRMQVVLTIGRFGYAEDEPLLIEALNDLEWWVRYRAAFALVSMPEMTDEKIQNLIATLPNQFTRDILKHVTAEINLKCLLKPSSFNLSR